MRKFLIAVALLGGMGLMLLLLGGRGEPGQPVDERGAPTDSGPSQAREARAGAQLQPERPEDLVARGTAEAGSTPRLVQAPSEDDGVLEVEVLAGERPVSGASVRLYWRGPRDPNLDEVAWRLASTGVTDAQGMARLASRPGGYLLSVRAQGLAPLRRDVVRPFGEARTVLRVTLEPGQALTGRTVVQGSQEPLPLVELVLTAHGRKLELWQRAEAPAEERVYASSDERGNFRLEGLAPGSYLLEGRAPGHARAVLRDVKVPAAGPLTVVLQPASVIEGFVVDAQGQPAAGAEVQVSGREPQVTTSGSGGGFSLEVEAGAYTVSARRGGEAGAVDKPVIVSMGKTVRDVRIRLGLGAALEGRVVARSTGAPIAGVSVDVSPYGSSGDSGRAVTDASGRFSVEGLAPGSYDLVASAPGFSSHSRRALTVAAGERFPLEIQLLGTGAVEGVVRDGAGRPVSGAQILGGERWAGALTRMSAEARTDAQGRYRLEGLTAGPQSLTARREGATIGAAQPVAIKEGATVQVDFTLEETGTIEGVVRAASGPLPAEQLIVLVTPRKQHGFAHFEYRPIEADATGAFRMSLAPGSYELRAMVRGLPGLQDSKTVEVEVGRSVRVELTLPDERGGELLRGGVLEPDGTPSPGAFVRVSSEEPRRPRGAALTDAQGRFSLSMSAEARPSQGRLIVTAHNGGRMGEVQGVRAGEQDVLVKLRPAASVRGRVVRSGGGAPVKGLALTLQTQEQGAFMGDSMWEFPGDSFEVRDAPAAPLKLTVRTADGAGGEALVSPAAGAVSEVEISVRSLGGVRGRVVDATTKAPVSGAIVFIEKDRLPSPDSGTTSDGRFSLEGVAPGERTLVVVGGPSRRFERRPVTLVEGQVLEVGDIMLLGAPPP